jgi:ribosomal protein S18 acetylase RimI-like enzyme
MHPESCIVIRTRVDSVLPMNGGGAVRLGEPDRARLEDLCLSCTAFYELIEGRSATEATATEILGPLEPKCAQGTKHVWGVEAHGKLIAVAELLQGYPSTHDWYIGLLLVAPEQRRKGIGSQFCASLMRWMAVHGATTVRLVVHQQNAGARSFWGRQGFAVERKLVKRSGHLEGPVWIFVRSISLIWGG